MKTTSPALEQLINQRLDRREELSLLTFYRLKYYDPDTVNQFVDKAFEVVALIPHWLQDILKEALPVTASEVNILCEVIANCNFHAGVFSEPSAQEQLTMYLHDISEHPESYLIAACANYTADEYRAFRNKVIPASGREILGLMLGVQLVRLGLPREKAFRMSE